MQFAGRSSSSLLTSRHTAQLEAIPLERVPPSPGSFTPRSHARRMGRKCLLVHGGSRGRGPTQGATAQAKAAAGKERFLVNLPVGGGGAGAARAGHGGGCGGATSATSHVEHTLLSGTHHHRPHCHQGWVARGLPVPSVAEMQIYHWPSLVLGLTSAPRLQWLGGF